MVMGIQPNPPQKEVWSPKEMERSLCFYWFAPQHFVGLSSQSPESILDDPEGMA